MVEIHYPLKFDHDFVTILQAQTLDEFFFNAIITVCNHIS